ncbi:MAG: HD-GYP domain-containing protein, partial [Cetobacterium sp.]
MLINIQKFYSKIKGFYLKNKSTKSIYFKKLEKYKIENNLRDHMIRVTEYAGLLADFMCLDNDKIEEIKKAALFHDLGKILIDEKILKKSSELTSEEFQKMKEHSKLGLKVLKKKDANFIVENIILLHHEKWNGTGYPFGLKGPNIPLEARIVSIADCYDALTSNRVYKNKISHEKALQILESESGQSF